jgi:hypothetical protein
MSAHITPHDAEAIEQHLASAEANLARVREALAAGDDDGARNAATCLAYDARLVEARTEQALMLTERFWR